MKRFRAVLYNVGINRCVDVPPEIVAKFGDDPYIPVTAEANGHPFRGTLLPAGGAVRRLYLNSAVRKAAGVDTGDTVTVSIALDLESRDPAVPPELEEHRETLELLPPGQRREILQWLGAAKGKSTREARLRKTLAHLAKKGLR